MYDPLRTTLTKVSALKKKFKTFLVRLAYKISHTLYNRYILTFKENSMFKTFARISACAALAACLFLSSAARAQDLVVTIPSLNEVQTKVAAVAGKINPTYPLLINMTLGQSAAFGIDATKPIAIFADPDTEKGFSVAGFVPVKSQKMFDAQIAALKENGLQDLNVESKDGYSVLLYNKDSVGALPKFDTPKLLNFKMNPEVVLPILDQQIAAADLLQDEEERNTKKVNLERTKRNLKQLEELSFSLDASDSGDMALTFGTKPVAGTDIANNFANTEKLTQSMLCGFFDKKAPFAAQFLGAFDENNRKDLVEAVTSTAKIPEDLADVVLKAMEVKKFDFACSFYPEKNGVYGVLAMGIANGDKINAAIEKAIAKIDADDMIQGKANAGTIGKSITVHEFTIKNDGEDSNFAVAVHQKYLFVALAPAGSTAVNYLKSVFKDKGLKPAEVKKNAQLHFNMELVSSLMKQIKPDEDIDYAGELNYVGDYTNGSFNGTVNIDGSLMETLGKLISIATSVEADDDDDDIFGDDDDDDETTEALAAPGDDDDDDDDI